MPVKIKAVETLVRAIYGGLGFNNLQEIAYIGPPERRRTITVQEFEETYTAAYEKMIRSMDWKRVLLEATSRHIELNHGETQKERRGVYDWGPDMPCAECIEAALLAGKTWMSWQDNPPLDLVPTPFTEQRAKKAYQEEHGIHDDALDAQWVGLPWRTRYDYREKIEQADAAEKEAQG
jgi:hypothetical protein